MVGLIIISPYPKFLMFLIIFIIIGSAFSVDSWPKSLPPGLQSLDIAKKLRSDPEAIGYASTDYGHIVTQKPAAVFYPSSVDDIVTLVKFAYNNNNSSLSFRVAAAGRTHSVRGQAMAGNGVVVNMTSLAGYRNGTGITFGGGDSTGFYADVGGEQILFDVLQSMMTHGFAPVTWTDYLYTSIGGVLSNAGIGGETFSYGPVINHVIEMDVITGKGELVTCSKDKNSDLYNAVLGGLGQFGIITRARIDLARAEKNVKWVRLLYSNFSDFTKDQQSIISEGNAAVSYLEGHLLLASAPGIWNSTFYSLSDQSRITTLVTNYTIIYSLELAMFYDDISIVNQELQVLLKELSFLPGFMFEKDVPYADFINRVHTEELALRAVGLWQVPHPWLNLFVPASRMSDFDTGVFRNIVVKGNITTGLVLVYPMNRSKWYDSSLAVIPEEETFYTVGFLLASGFGDWEKLDDQNKRVLQFCEDAGIQVKQYLSHHESEQEWAKHFGAKWATVQQMKAKYDPKMILSPGQGIFNNFSSF